MIHFLDSSVAIQSAAPVPDVIDDNLCRLRGWLVPAQGLDKVAFGICGYIASAQMLACKCKSIVEFAKIFQARCDPDSPIK